MKNMKIIQMIIMKLKTIKCSYLNTVKKKLIKFSKNINVLEYQKYDLIINKLEIMNQKNCLRF